MTERRKHPVGPSLAKAIEVIKEFGAARVAKKAGILYVTVYDIGRGLNTNPSCNTVDKIIACKQDLANESIN
jgi:hypothetical protein